MITLLGSMELTLFAIDVPFFKKPRPHASSDSVIFPGTLPLRLSASFAAGGF